MEFIEKMINWVKEKIYELKEKYEVQQKEQQRKNAERKRIYEERLTLARQDNNYINWLLTQPEINDRLYAKYMQASKNPMVNVPVEERKKIDFLNYSWKINNNALPQLDCNIANIISKKGEILHYCCQATLLEVRSKTEKINYGGLTGSIPICKGIKYRWGSMDIQPERVTYLQEIEDGKFFISNMRIGFRSVSKNFILSFNKILSIDIDDSIGLLIYKDGREKPYILSLDEYDIPCLLMSNLIKL